MSDRLLGGILLVMALAYIAGAIAIQSAMIFDPLGPRVFPIICGGMVAVACLYPLARPDPEPDWPALSRAAEMGAVVVGLVVYAYALPQLGFILSTAVASAVLSWRLGARARMAPVYGAAIAVGIYAVFQLALGLSLPTGRWVSAVTGL